MNFIIYAMVYLGSALMVFNIIGFIRFARNIKNHKQWGSGNFILYFPISLLVMFLIGYLAVGIFGKPDIIVSGILFGGSIFVFVMYRMLSGITLKIRESERLGAQLMATEESNKAKRAFLASVSHEMRTPMNVIIGLDSIALKDKSLSVDTRAHLERINVSANQLLGMINNVLELNNVEAGSFEIRDGEFSLREAVDQLGSVTSAACAGKGIVYKVSSSDCVGMSYYGDVHKIKQVLLSILENAVKYTDAPGAVGFTVSGERDGEYEDLTFDISDTGAGIDPEFMPHIFEAFTKEESGSTESKGGSGIGLTVSKNIIERMGGSLSVQSRKNVGSVFTVSLRLKIAKETEDKPEKRDLSQISLAGRRILVVDDIPENAEIVVDLLELEDAICECAENGKIALDMFLASPEGYYDAILMDLRMPVMDGHTSAAAMRSSAHPDAKTVPIIALSANAFDSDIQQSVQAGMNDHLSKPADSELLYNTIKNYLRQ